MAKGRLLTTLIILIVVSFYMYESKKALTPIPETRFAQKTIQVNEVPAVPTAIDIPKTSKDPESKQPKSNTRKKTVAPKKSNPQQKIVKQSPPAKPIKTSSLAEAPVQVIPKKRIVVKNNITKKMLGYKHWSGTYRPNIFALKVNGICIDQGQEKSIELTDNTLNVHYDYSFMNGYRKGAKNEIFELDKKATAATITFSWKNDWHVLIDTAKPRSTERVEFDA